MSTWFGWPHLTFQGACCSLKLKSYCKVLVLHNPFVFTKLNWFTSVLDISISSHQDIQSLLCPLLTAHQPQRVKVATSGRILRWLPPSTLYHHSLAVLDFATCWVEDSLLKLWSRKVLAWWSLTIRLLLRTNFLGCQAGGKPGHIFLTVFFSIYFSSPRSA